MKIPLELPSLVILTGGLGSGKTELASNFAFSFSEMGEKNISIIDLDNIKPYFKVRNLRADYKSAGIAMIAPPLEYLHSDLPLLPAQARNILLNSKDRIVVDIGGDESGARVLGGYRDEILTKEHEFLFVINTSRPYPNDASSIIAMVKDVEMESGLKVTGLINNTHLLAETDEEIFLQGREIALDVSSQTGVPLVLNTVYNDVKITAELKEPVYRIDLYFMDMMF